VTGIAVSSTRITLTVILQQLSAAIQCLFFQIDAATGTQTALLTESLKSHGADIVKSGTGYVILEHRTLQTSSVITNMDQSIQRQQRSTASRITGLAGYLPGTIKVAGNGWNVFSCSDASGIRMLMHYRRHNTEVFYNYFRFFRHNVYVQRYRITQQ